MTDTDRLRIRLNTSYWKHLNAVPFSEDVVPSSLFLRNKHFLVVDLETQNLVQDVGGWGNIDKLKISVACAYDSKTDQFLTFRENEISKLNDLCEERLVVGYNIRGFDLIILKAYGLNLEKLDVFDIMYDVQTLTRQKFLKLETLAQGTLNAGKSADGLMAVEWWKTGEIDKIIQYCQQDVQVTRDIFEYGRKNGIVKLRRADGSDSEVKVNWN
ncbi:MAG: ribonuclease H-like domain-containing protein [Bdellovibrionales bacterium]|nr:ribonuclease H-like domain-containing protein [Bdellovibrionales bacterium]